MSAQAQQIASLSSNAVMQIVSSSYSRRDEYESDKLGLKYMDLAGYDVNGMVRTFELLKKESKGSQGPVWLRSHPHLEDRIARTKQEIKRIRQNE